MTTLQSGPISTARCWSDAGESRLLQRDRRSRAATGGASAATRRRLGDAPAAARRQSHAISAALWSQARLHTAWRPDRAWLRITRIWRRVRSPASPAQTTPNLLPPWHNCGACPCAVPTSATAWCTRSPLPRGLHSARVRACLWATPSCEQRWMPDAARYAWAEHEMHTRSERRVHAEASGARTSLAPRHVPEPCLPRVCGRSVPVVGYDGDESTAFSLRAVGALPGYCRAAQTCRRRCAT